MQKFWCTNISEHSTIIVKYFLNILMWWHVTLAVVPRKQLVNSLIHKLQSIFLYCATFHYIEDRQPSPPHICSFPLWVWWQVVRSPLNLTHLLSLTWCLSVLPWARTEPCESLPSSSQVSHGQGKLKYFRTVQGFSPTQMETCKMYLTLYIPDRQSLIGWPRQSTTLSYTHHSYS